eukprot:6846374-Prymnesium_polylepis.1
MQMLTATIANADLEPPRPPPSSVPIVVDDLNLLVRALCTLMYYQVGGYLPNVNKATGPSIRRATRSLERMDPPVVFTGLSPVEI